MKSIIGWVAIMLVAVVVVGGILALGLCSGCAASGYTNKVQTGPQVAGAGEKPMMLVKVEKGIFGGKFEGRVTGGSVVASSIKASDSQPSGNQAGGKYLEIIGPNLQTENFGELTDAATRQMAQGMLPLAIEFRALQKQYGENTVNIITAAAGLVSAIEDGLPAGQIRQAAEKLIDAYAEVQKAKISAASQPAAKSDPSPVATQ